MTTALILIFVFGYLCIALEHKLKIDKAAIALVMCGTMWTLYTLFAHDAATASTLAAQLGDTCEILIFLIGAMTIVNLIDSHGGFNVITDHITTRNKHKLLWLLAVITFFLSAVLDNMTTTIIMIMLLRRLIAETRDRWIFAGIIVIAANSGGAWSPIGDVTTIMLWMKGNITAWRLIEAIFLPALVSTVVPTAIAARMIRNEAVAAAAAPQPAAGAGNPAETGFGRTILAVGVAALLLVPVFKSLTGLPPYMGMIIALGIVWIITEIFYDRHRRDIEESIQNRVAKVLKHIDMPTILFFLGILMAVAALQSAGVLSSASDFLDRKVHGVFAVSGVIGILSSVIDNVPLVAACMGMYPIADAAAVAASADPAYLQSFVCDGTFWHLLAYCAGVGGSLLIIGSAAGVVAMGLEKLDFGWYLRHISRPALLGYIAGMAVILAEKIWLGI